MPSKTDRFLALGCHMASLVSPFGTPLLAMLITVVIWSVHRADSAYVEHHGREALNFQITHALIIAAILLLSSLWFFATVAWRPEAPIPYNQDVLLRLSGFGSPLYLAALVVYPILALFAVVAAWRCKLFRYPLIFRFIKQ